MKKNQVDNLKNFLQAKQTNERRSDREGAFAGMRKKPKYLRAFVTSWLKNK
jgi:hypothetical protein